MKIKTDVGTPNQVIHSKLVAQHVDCTCPHCANSVRIALPSAFPPADPISAMEEFRTRFIECAEFNGQLAEENRLLRKKLGLIESLIRGL